MTAEASLLALRMSAEILLGGGIAVVALVFAAQNVARLRASLSAYASNLTQELSFLRLPHSAKQIIGAQALGLVLTCLCLLLGFGLAASVLVVIVAAPKSWLHGRRVKRVNEIEEQLDGWLQGLAASLRATPSLGEGIEFSMGLVHAPLRDEIGVLVKEQRLGTPLDDALAHLGERVASRTVQSALSALRIGRNTGGDLSTILERSASALREMARLEGVVRTKTAEGKAQAYVVAVLPFPMVGLLSYLSPSLLAPLVESFRGYCVVAAAVALWVAAIAIARKVLDVDI